MSSRDISAEGIDLPRSMKQVVTPCQCRRHVVESDDSVGLYLRTFLVSGSRAEKHQNVLRNFDALRDLEKRIQCRVDRKSSDLRISKALPRDVSQVSCNRSASCLTVKP